MTTIQHDIDIIKQSNEGNLIKSMLFGSFLISPSTSNDIDLLFYVKEKKDFVIPKRLLNEVVRVQYNYYKSDKTIKNKKGLDILVIDNRDGFNFVKSFNKNKYKII